MKITLCILQTLLCFVCYSQEFAPIGAEWHYTEYFAFSGDISYVNLTSEKDTIVDGISCRKIVKNNRFYCHNRPLVEYIFSRNDSVFHYDTAFNEFQLLYDFNAEANDSWTFKIYDDYNFNNGNIDTIIVSVDSTSYISVNGIQLKQLHVQYEKLNDFAPDLYYSTIIERIGDIQYMFNWNPWASIACDINYSGGLRCYYDSIVGLYNPGIFACEYELNTSIEEQFTPQFKLSPNPSNNLIRVSCDDHNLRSLEIYDVQGNLIELHENINSLTITLNIESYKEGIYFMHARNTFGLIQTLKFVKQ